MATKRDHIPAPGKSNGLQGTALCGAWAHYLTGDHEMIRRGARQAIKSGDEGNLCRSCLAKLRPYYVCAGSVRGECGHRHATASGALRCLLADQAGCERQRGYSDRDIVARNGAPAVVVEQDEDGRSFCVDFDEMDRR